MNKYRSFSKNEAERIVAFFKPSEKIKIFQFPDNPNEFTVTEVSIAPYPDYEYSVFKKNFNFFKGSKLTLQLYTEHLYRVIVIAEIDDYTKVVSRQPHFFDIHELSEKGITDFVPPENILDTNV